MGKQESDLCRIVTGIVRFNYVNIEEKKARYPGDEEKYYVCVLINKDDNSTLAKITRAMDAATEGGTKLWKDDTSSVSCPIRDGDVENSNREEYINQFYINASSRYKPQVIDCMKNRIDNSIIYSGCYGKVSLTFFPYFHNGKKGVGCSLNNIQFINDGVPISNVINAEDEFDVEYNVDEGIF